MPPLQIRLIMKFLVFLTLILFLLGCGSEKKLSPLVKDRAILAFGDSLTYGYGASANLSYPAQLSKLLNIEVINEGVSGEVSSRGLIRLEALLDDYEPQLLILCHGANDMLKKQDLQIMQQNLSKMIEMAQQQDIQIVLMSVPEASLFLPDIMQYQTLAEQYNLPLENDIIKEVLKQPDLRSDMFHPNAQGYTLIAEALYELLAENGALD